jgi:protein SCO1/2
MKQAACLAWLICALGLMAAPALADRHPQRVNPTVAGWPVGPFALTDHRGAPFTQDRLHGRWTLLVLLEDSQCGAPCEAALTALAGLFRRIHATQALKRMQVVLVAPGSPGEPPERLEPYLARFDPRFIGVHGSRSALLELADDLGAAPPDPTSQAAALDRSGSIWVIGPDGILRAEFLPPFDVLLLTAEFMKTRARR